MYNYGVWNRSYNIEFITLASTLISGEARGLALLLNNGLGCATSALGENFLAMSADATWTL
jgi:hypothetical protein